MYEEPVEVLLGSIDKEIEQISGCVDTLLKRIDAFQQDPAKLELGGRLARYVSAIVRDLFSLDYRVQLQRGRVFYNLCKVVRWRKVVVHLPTDVCLLSDLLAGLRSGGKDWQYSYLLLSWVYILTLAPFNFEELYDEIKAISVSFQGQRILQPIVAKIDAQLLYKNEKLLQREFSRLDLLTLNSLLKRVKLDDSVIDEKAVNHFNSLCLQEDGLVALKVLPKLFRVNAAHEKWEVVEDIISFYLDHLNDSSTDYRFALAHSYSKVISIFINEFNDTETALELVETCLDQIRVCLRDTSPAVVDHDLLHTNLLIIAELSTLISVTWPQLLDIITRGIIPFASKFEQLRGNQIKGSQIKDASNFICWSLARSTRLQGVSLSSEVKRIIFLNLLMCSVFDRDLVVRRSANAAFQEVLGRCFSLANILDSKTIIGLIELPIVNLKDSFIKNTHTMYRLFTMQESYVSFAEFLLDWLIKQCLIDTNDLNTAQLAVQALSSLLEEYPSSISLMRPKLEGLLTPVSYNEPLTVARILSLLITLESGNRLTSQGIIVFPQMKQYFEIILSSVRPGHKALEDDQDEHFKFNVILKYWIFTSSKEFGLRFDHNQIKVCFHIARVTPESHSESKLLFGELIAAISMNFSSFSQPEDEIAFWAAFEKFIRFNNSLACSAIPHLPPSRFQLVFNKLLRFLDCQRKADLLNALNDSLTSLIDAVGTPILRTIVHLLSDYTVTQQGDVGRLVRTAAARIVSSHRHLFWNRDIPNLTDDTVANLLRLSGEQVTDLRQICFSTLCEAFSYQNVHADRCLNRQLLDFSRAIFRDECIDFWKGYMMTAGAIHFTDSEVADAMDCFLTSYEQLSNDQDRLALCNSMVRVIPTAKQLTQMRNSPSTNPWGITEIDIVKVTTTYLNFWKRLLESGLTLDRNFNFDGFYAKIYNLNLVKGNSLLKTLTIQLLPYLVSSQAIASGILDKNFANKVICRLLSLAKREALLKQPNLSLVQRESILALTQIYLESESFDHLRALRNTCRSADGIVNLSEAQLLL